MVEAMIEELENNQNCNEHPHKKHCAPFVSEVTVVISQLTTKKRKE